VLAQKGNVLFQEPLARANNAASPVAQPMVYPIYLTLCLASHFFIKIIASPSSCVVNSSFASKAFSLLFVDTINARVYGIMLIEETAETMQRLRIKAVGAVNAATAWAVAVKAVPVTI
jgi:hypothetical protein